jgi:sorbitol-specific phosphotransferase system component IIA
MCGIVGYSGIGPADPLKLKILMLYNKERGLHATGISIDHKLNKNSDVVDLFLARNEINITTEKTNTVIAHTRQASAGMDTKKKEYAHPFHVYENAEDLSELEERLFDEEIVELEPELVLAMNGTINNMWDLGRKYEVEGYSSTKSDTFYFSKILAKHPDKLEEILQSYKGAANLLFYYVKDGRDTLNVWKDPERPLYCWMPKDKQEIYISSVADGLRAIGAPDDKSVLTFKNEHLYTIVAGKILSLKPLEKLVSENTYFGEACGYSQHDDWGDESPEDSSFIHRPMSTAVRKVNNDPDRSYIYSSIGCVYFDPVTFRYFHNHYPYTGMIAIDERGKVFIEGENFKNYNYHYFLFGYLVTKKTYGRIMQECGKNHSQVKSYIKTRTADQLSAISIAPVKSVALDGQYWMDNKPAKGAIKIPITQYVAEFVGGKMMKLYRNGQPEEISTGKELPTKIDIEKYIVSCMKDYFFIDYLDMEKELSDHFKFEITDNTRTLMLDAFLTYMERVNDMPSVIASSIFEMCSNFSKHDSDYLSSLIHAVYTAANEPINYSEICYIKEKGKETKPTEDPGDRVPLGERKSFVESVRAWKEDYGKFVFGWFKTLNLESIKDVRIIHEAFIRVLVLDNKITRDKADKILATDDTAVLSQRIRTLLYGLNAEVK